MSGKSVVVIVGIATLILAVFALVPPYPQPLEYHGFADARSLWGIPNALDVLSNLPFVIVGILGLQATLQMQPENEANRHRLHYTVFFVGFVLTGVGSAYYHLSPDNDSLVWDRLPMTIAFMAFFSSVVSELISERTGRTLLPVLVVVGVASVTYWAWTESTGRGDLRAYGLVQFLPILLIPLLLLLYPTRPGYTRAVLAMGACYLLAKLFEHFDKEIFGSLQFVSGHSLKHVAAAVGGLFLIGLLRDSPSLRTATS